MLLLFIIGISALSSSIPFKVYAQEVNPKPASEKVDAVLVLDNSGSMLLTDPLNLRQEGAKLFTQFLKAGDRLSIVSFSNEATVVKPLEEYNPKDQGTVSSLLSSIVASGEYTNIAAGIDKAISILKNNQREGANQTIILMSDGKMEPPPNSDSAVILSSKLTETTLPDLKKDGIKLYTLAFSEQADKYLLQEFAALTDGISWFTPTSEKIHESFANLFLAVKKPQVAPQTKKGFKLDADVQEATFYINRDEQDAQISVIRPDGSTFDSKTTDSDIKWFTGKQFDIVTVQLPAAGDWQITGVANQEGFATLLTKLRLVSEWPSNIYAYDEVVLEVRLYEEDKPISLPEMSGTIQFAFQVTPTDKISEPIIRDFLKDDGKDGDRVARDGVFSKKISIKEQGEYKLRVLAKAPTFERNQQIPFRVKPPLIKVSVEEMTDQIKKIVAGGDEHEDSHDGTEHDQENAAHAKEDHTQEQKVFLVSLNEDMNSLKKSSVKLIVVDEKKSRFELPLVVDKLNKTKYYSAVNLLPKEGKFKVYATITGENKRNQEIRGESIPFEYVYHLHSNEHKEDVHIVQKAPEAPKKEKPASPTIPIILMTLLTGGAIFGVSKFLAKTRSGEASDTPSFPPLDAINSIINRLKEIQEKSEIDLSLPFLQSADVTLPKIWSEGSAVQDIAQSVGQTSSTGNPQTEEVIESKSESSQEKTEETTSQDTVPQEQESTGEVAATEEEKA